MRINEDSHRLGKDAATRTCGQSTRGAGPRQQRTGPASTCGREKPRTSHSEGRRSACFALDKERTISRRMQIEDVHLRES
jgi:hypothetical protein